MSSTLTLGPRYVLAMSASFLLWLIPINVKAPRFITFLSFVASGAGYLYSFTLASPLSDQRWYAANKNQQERDLMLSDLAFEQLAAEQSLKIQYFGVAELDDQEVDTAGEVRSLSSAATKQLSAPKPQTQLSELEQGLLGYVLGTGSQYADQHGWFSVSELQQRWGKKRGMNAGAFRDFLLNSTIGAFKDSSLAQWMPAKARP